MGETGYYSLKRDTSNREVLQYDLCVNCIGSTYLSEERFSVQLRHDYYLIYIQDGNVEISTPELKATIKKGDILIIPPHVRSTLYLKQNGYVDYMWLHFTGKKASELLEKVQIDVNKVYSIGTHSIFVNEWKRLYSEFITNDIYFDEICISALNNIMIYFSRYIHKTPFPTKLKSIVYIHENLYSDLKISQLAKIEGFCENRYRDLFQKIVGVSPLDYIINNRIEAAKVRLNNTEESVSEIAKSVGYNDAYYFSRLFKKKVGMSPAQYRKTTSYNHHTNHSVTKGNGILLE